MSFNSFGRVLRFTTWGESHGPALGAVVAVSMLAFAFVIMATGVLSAAQLKRFVRRKPA